MDTAQSENSVPGQVVFPEMADELGYEVIVLKPWQERFCWEYVFRGDNGYRAYKAVKPKSKDTTARVEASKLLTNPDIRQRIDQIKAEQLRRHQVTADHLMIYHSKVMHMDRQEFVVEDDKGVLKPKRLKDMDQEALSIVDLHLGTDKDGNVITHFTVPERQDSANEMARILGLHKERKEICAPGGGPVETHSVVETREYDEEFNALRKEFKRVKDGSA